MSEPRTVGFYAGRSNDIPTCTDSHAVPETRPMTITLFKHKSATVEARRMIDDAKEQRSLAEWCGGQLSRTLSHAARVRGLKLPRGACVIHLLRRPDYEEVMVGDWVVKEPDGLFYVYRAARFDRMYKILTSTERKKELAKRKRLDGLDTTVDRREATLPALGAGRIY